MLKNAESKMPVCDEKKYEFLSCKAELICDKHHTFLILSCMLYYFNLGKECVHRFDFGSVAIFVDEANSVIILY